MVHITHDTFTIEIYKLTNYSEIFQKPKLKLKEQGFMKLKIVSIVKPFSLLKIQLIFRLKLYFYLIFSNKINRKLSESLNELIIIDLFYLKKLDKNKVLL